MSLSSHVRAARGYIQLARSFGERSQFDLAATEYELALKANARIIRELTERLADLQDKAQIATAEEFIRLLETLEEQSR